MIDFAALGRAAEALLHKDEARLFAPVLVPDGMGSQRPGEPEDLGAIRGNLQSYSAERAQAEYGVTCRAERRLFCAPDARIVPGVLVEETDGHALAHRRRAGAGQKPRCRAAGAGGGCPCGRK